MNVPRINDSFIQFIKFIFERINLSDEHINYIIIHKNMVLLRKAFTHKSYDSQFNYEVLEFVGDTIVNACITQYILERFPKIKSIKWLTELKHSLTSKNILSKIALENGFQYHILMSKKIQQNTKSKIYLSVLEDVFEALFGALFEILNARFDKGVSYSVIYNIIKTYFDPLYISLNWRDVFDINSRLNELFTRLNWNMKENIITKKERDKYKTIIYGDINDKKVEISYGYGPSKDTSRNKASIIALTTLKNKYNIKEVISSPYVNYIKAKYDQSSAPNIPKVTKYFKEYMVRILLQCRLRKHIIDLLTTNRMLYKFQKSLTYSSYSKYNNYDMYKFFGITFVDLIIAEYLYKKFKSRFDEKRLTIVKHKLISGDSLYEITKQLELQEYIHFGGELVENLDRFPNLDLNKKYKNMMKGLLKSFIGAIILLIDEETMIGVGFNIAYSFLSGLLDEMEILVKDEEIIGAKTRLKEYLDKQNIKLSDVITVTFDQESKKHTAIAYIKSLGLRTTGIATTKSEAEQIASQAMLNKIENILQ